MTRLLVWLEGAIDSRLVERQADGRISIVMPIAKAIALLDLPEDTDLWALMHDVL